jgi:hypothetical protein
VVDRSDWLLEDATSRQLLPEVGDIYSRYPEFRDLEAWELQHVIFSLGYFDELEDEGEISAAIDAVRTAPRSVARERGAA